ncbi:glycosyltransferase family 25 protein [Vibrio cholerae]
MILSSKNVDIKIKSLTNAKWFSTIMLLCCLSYTLFQAAYREVGEVFLHFETLALKYDFLKLAATKPKSFKLISTVNDKINVVRFKKRTCGIMGYVLTPHAASSFIKNAIQFIEPVDDYMEKPYKHGIATYVLRPDIVKRADIQSTIGKSRKDKSDVRAWNKVYIETFRLYEQLSDLLSFTYKPRK